MQVSKLGVTELNSTALEILKIEKFIKNMFFPGTSFTALVCYSYCFKLKYT